MDGTSLAQTKILIINTGADGMPVVSHKAMTQEHTMTFDRI